MKTPFCGFVFSNLVDGKSFPSSPKAVAALAVPKTEAFEDIPKVSNIQKKTDHRQYFETFSQNIWALKKTKELRFYARMILIYEVSDTDKGGIFLPPRVPTSALWGSSAFLVFCAKGKKEDIWWDHRNTVCMLS